MLDKILLENTLFELYESTTYNNTKIALDEAIDKVIARMMKTKGELTKKQLEDLKATIESYISNGYKNTFDDMKEEITEVSGLTYDYMLLDVATKGIPTSVINDLLSSDRNIQGYEFKDLFQLTEANHIRSLKVALASGVSQGLSLPNLVKSILEKHDGITKGQLKTNIYTTITDSREVARYKSYEKFEAKGLIKGYESVGTLDFRTSEICRTLDGVKYFENINEVPNKPPRHFNCRTKLVPITKNQFDTGKRASKFGEVSKDLNYEQWFNSIDDDTKQKFMTPNKYKAYKNGLFNVKNVADLKQVGKKLDLKDIDSVFKKAKTIPKIDFGYDGKFNEYVEDIRDEAKIVIDKLPKPKEIKFDKKATHIFSFEKMGSIVATIDNQSTFLHEYGHHIDNALGTKNKTGTMYWSKKELLEDFKKDRDFGGYGSYKFYDKYFEDNYKKVEIIASKGAYKGKVIGYRFEMINQSDNKNRFSDMFDSLSLGQIQASGGYGHGTKYYKSTENVMTENFANMFALWSDKKEWEKAKELFPNMTGRFERIMKEVVDE